MTQMGQNTNYFFQQFGINSTLSDLIAIPLCVQMEYKKICFI